jgi:hypothetical protein
MHLPSWSDLPKQRRTLHPIWRWCRFRNSRSITLFFRAKYFTLARNLKMPAPMTDDLSPHSPRSPHSPHSPTHHSPLTHLSLSFRPFCDRRPSRRHHTSHQSHLESLSTDSFSWVLPFESESASASAMHVPTQIESYHTHQHGQRGIVTDYTRGLSY